MALQIGKFIYEPASKIQKIKKMPPNLQVIKLHKSLKFRQYLLVCFGDLVFW